MGVLHVVMVVGFPPLPDPTAIMAMKKIVKKQKVKCKSPPGFSSVVSNSYHRRSYPMASPAMKKIVKQKKVGTSLIMQRYTVSFYIFHLNIEYVKYKKVVNLSFILGAPSRLVKLSEIMAA